MDEALHKVGLKCVRRALGDGVFIAQHPDFPEYTQMLAVCDWSISQLRAMADHMEENPNLTIFPDGSGKPVKK